MSDIKGLPKSAGVFETRRDAVDGHQNGFFQNLFLGFTGVLAQAFDELDLDETQGVDMGIAVFQGAEQDRILFQKLLNLDNLTDNLHGPVIFGLDEVENLLP